MPRPAESLSSVKVGPKEMQQIKCSVPALKRAESGQSSTEARVGQGLHQRDFGYLHSGTSTALTFRSGASKGRKLHEPLLTVSFKQL